MAASPLLLLQAQDAELFCPRRLPALGDGARRLLKWMREHPQAPRYRNYSGHRLNAGDVAWVRARSREIEQAQLPADPLVPPAWLQHHLAACWRHVPYWRSRGTKPPAAWHDVPCTSRAELSADIARFVPDDAALDRMICFTTSGTTGHPLKLPSHPRVAALYAAHHRRALRLFGIEPRAGAGEVGIVLAGYQQRCFTYVSVDPLRGECGLAKLNLHPDEWRHPGDRAIYLDALRPELVSGDPVSLAELAGLGLAHAPRAVLSTSMAMLPGQGAALSRALRAPIVDIYSMNEAGPLAVFLPGLGHHLLLQAAMHVEIVDENGRPCPLGTHGEIVLSGGMNPWLPLLRYRTGDHAALIRTPLGPALADLQGRPPVSFHAGGGRRLNNIEVTHALKGLALRRFALHQHADGSLSLRADADDAQRQLAVAALRRLFGPGTVLHAARLAAEDKVVQYTSDLPTRDLPTSNLPT